MLFDNKNKFITIALVISSVLIGVYAEAILDITFKNQIESNPQAPIWWGLLIFSTLILITATFLAIYIQQNQNDKMEIKKELNNINESLGLTVTFVHDPPQRSTGEVYKRCRQIVEKAEKEILIVTRSGLQDSDRLGVESGILSQQYEAEIINYFNALHEKIKNNRNTKYFFRRILQSSEGADISITKDRVGERRFHHLKNVLEFLEEYPECGYFKVAPILFEHAFLIVDERYVILTIEASNPDQKVHYMEGVLIFDDPQKKLVRYLKNFFNKVDAHGVIVKNFNLHEA